MTEHHALLWCWRTQDAKPHASDHLPDLLLRIQPLEIQANSAVNRSQRTGKIFPIPDQAKTEQPWTEVVHLHLELSPSFEALPRHPSADIPTGLPHVGGG